MKSFKRKLKDLVEEAKDDNKKQKLLIETLQNAKPPAFKAIITINDDDYKRISPSYSIETPEFETYAELYKYIMQMDELVEFFDHHNENSFFTERLIDDKSIPKDFFDPDADDGFKPNPKYSIKKQFEIFYKVSSSAEFIQSRWDFVIKNV